MGNKNTRPSKKAGDSDAETISAHPPDPGKLRKLGRRVAEESAQHESTCTRRLALQDAGELDQPISLCCWKPVKRDTRTNSSSKREKKSRPESDSELPNLLLLHLFQSLF
ncbi:hypothetical protein PoB_001921400 [Plakobranchus ocellatus]|uniref:Uncharacterized protein n=1 Tax=Plakobranchus ocellatus TaxID=259542 RepID=A0AAV3ZFP2_9GAST|nr:hypothetical protein PoB_001921400 [Plakobranchus ocellatus]